MARSRTAIGEQTARADRSWIAIPSGPRPRLFTTAPREPERAFAAAGSESLKSPLPFAACRQSTSMFQSRLIAAVSPSQSMPRYNPALDRTEMAGLLGGSSRRSPPRGCRAGPKKLYVLDMFPYPSGDGLHVGHPEGYTATDIVCRFERMRGRACCTRWAGTPSACRPSNMPSRPARRRASTTEKNIATFRRQLKMLGFSYDWDRELATTDADYFRWTQWIFLVLFDTWFDASAATRPADRRAADSAGRRRGGRRCGRAAIRTSIGWPISSKRR